MRFRVRDVFPVEPKQQVVAGRPSEFETTHGKADRSVRTITTADALDRPDPVHPFEQPWAASRERLMARIEARLEVRVLPRADGGLAPAVMNENFKTSCIRI